MRTFSLLAVVSAAAMCLSVAAADARSAITLYEHTNYEGASRTFYRSEPNLVGYNFNDIASSARVDGGVWEICEHVNYGGRCIRVGRDDRNFVPRGFNDMASSVRLIEDDRGWDDRGDRGDRDGRGPRWGGDDRGDRGDRGGWGSDIVLYEHVNFEGDQRRLDNDSGNLDRMGFNDTVSSIRIRRGVWEVCEHAFFRGRCMRFRHDVPNLVAYGFNDMISSVRRVD